MLIVIEAGKDLKKELEKYEGIAISGSGVLRRATIATAQSKLIFTQGPYELIACSGKLPNVRIIFCDIQGKCYGGKLMEGTIANTNLYIELK